MKKKADLKGIYAKSEDVVARDVQGEFIIIPITSGIGDLEDEIFSLNETGRAVWDKLDGKKTLKGILNELSDEFSIGEKEGNRDVLGFASELLKRKMLVEIVSAK